MSTGLNNIRHKAILPKNAYTYTYTVDKYYLQSCVIDKVNSVEIRSTKVLYESDTALQYIYSTGFIFKLLNQDVNINEASYSKL